MAAQQPKSVALMFPGQGSQYPGMGKDLAAESPTARGIFQRADDVLGYSLSRIMMEGAESDLTRTLHTQPAVFVHSMALLEVMRERSSLNPAIAAGHSLGEYSALCAAGVLSFDDALEIIHVRAKGMEEAQPPGTCAMAAIIGPAKDEVLEIVKSCRGEDILEAANFNAPDQVVVSGNLSAVNRVVEAAKTKPRTKAVLLPVSSAFHTVLMKPAQVALSEKLASVELRAPEFPVVANVTGRPYPFPDGVKGLMVEQLVNPVRWTDCVESMKQAQPDVFLEIGPGRVLSGLLRRIDRSASGISIGDLASLNAFEGSGS
ncbi:MAG: ACP S-malonyltransferase [Thermodesulfobacteriota bacterium]